MAQEQFPYLTQFVGNRGKICVLCRDMGIRKTITSILGELGLSSLVHSAPDDFREPKVQKAFFSAVEESQELVLIMDFNSETGPVYFHLLDDVHARFKEKLKVVAIVDKAYQGLISLLYARGAKGVLIKPFMPKDLAARVMSIFAAPSLLDKLIEYGRECLRQQDHEKAAAISRKIIAEFDHTHQSLLYCGDVALALGEYRDAGRFYILGFKDEQLSFQAYARLANLCSVTNRVRGEIYWLKKFAKINTLDFSNFIKIGELCLQQDKKDEAKEFFSKSLAAARKISSDEHVSDLVFNIANVCVDNDTVEMAKDYATALLRNGNVDKTLLSEVAYFRMNKLQDPDGACSIYCLLAVREEKRNTKMDVDFWSTALYNAAVCHHLAYGNQKIIKQKNSPKRASDYILEILNLNPDFGKDDPKINENIVAIASNPLQQNIPLTTLLTRLERL